MSQTTFDKSIAQLARDALADLGAIVSKEVRLGRAEVAEKVDRVASGVSGIAWGAALMIPGVTLLLFAAANALAAYVTISLWAAMAVIGAVASLAGYLVVKSGQHNAAPKNLTPTRVVENVKLDAAAVKGGL